MEPVRPLLDAAGLESLRRALRPFTVDALHAALGPIGQAAHSRGDLAGVARAVRGFDDRRLATLVRLFLLGAEVGVDDARTALDPLPFDHATAAGLVEESAGSCRGRYDIRPYGEGAAADDTGGDDPWWVVSDYGSDVRGGALEPDHVLGIGAAALTLAQATPRADVTSAVDVGTGCGVQALHLGRHAQRVVATDISPRALRLAATTAALSGQAWDLRAGSLLGPVAGEQHDLIVANPPFVVSPGGAGLYDYRDSGYAGDEVCRRLVLDLPHRLAPGGTAQLLANWIVPTDGSARERLEAWFEESGCHAWVWQREIAEPAEYVALWLRDAGQLPGTDAWTACYDAWLDWFAATGVAAVGMGMITMWRAGAGEPTAVVVEDVPQPLGAPLGPHVADWVRRQRHLATSADADLLGATYRVDADLVRTTQQLIDPDGGWRDARETLRQSHGMRWELEVDGDVAAIVAACATGSPPALAAELLAATRGLEPADVTGRLAPVLRDLLARGFVTAESM